MMEGPLESWNETVHTGASQSVFIPKYYYCDLMMRMRWAGNVAHVKYIKNTYILWKED
jgi:hypothetical protein